MNRPVVTEYFVSVIHLNNRYDTYLTFVCMSKRILKLLINVVLNELFFFFFRRLKNIFLNSGSVNYCYYYC